MLKVNVITLFPEMFSPLKMSIAARAQSSGIFELNLIQLRDFAINKHGQVDDSPFGGEAGMVLRPEPLAKALENIGILAKNVESPTPRPKVYFLSAHGQKFDHSLALELSEMEEIVLICGHYKGIDQRIVDHYVDEEISLGDFVLTGGEIPAMAIIDAAFRLIPGAMGNRESAEEDSFYDGLLGHPVYTRPAEFEDIKVPEVLLSGNHKKIEEWRKAEAIRLTREKRPDLAHLIPPEPPTKKRRRKKQSS